MREPAVTVEGQSIEHAGHRAGKPVLTVKRTEGCRGKQERKQCEPAERDRFKVGGD